MMLRITKFKTKAEVGDGTIQEMYQYKVLDGDKIIGTYAVQADYPNADTMAQIRLGQFIFKQMFDCSNLYKGAKIMIEEKHEITNS